MSLLWQHYIAVLRHVGTLTGAAVNVVKEER